MAMSPSAYMPPYRNVDDIKKRRGKFFINDSLIDTAPELIYEIMSKMIIIRAEHYFHDRTIQYMALSKDFEPVEDGAETPSIEIGCRQEDDGKWIVVCNYLDKNADDDSADRFNGIL